MSVFNFPKNTPVEQTLSRLDLRVPFLHFLKQEFSLGEGIAYMAIGQYRKSPTYAKANVLYKLYIDPDSKRACNVSESLTATPLREALLLSGSSLMSKAPYDLFDKAASEISLNLVDNYNRYTRSTSQRSSSMSLLNKSTRQVLGKTGTSLFNTALLGEQLVRKGIHSYKSMSELLVAGTEYASDVWALKTVGFDTASMSLDR